MARNVTGIDTNAASHEMNSNQAWRFTAHVFFLFYAEFVARLPLQSICILKSPWNPSCCSWVMRFCMLLDVE
ncbi:hypothetical protein IWQ49_005627 [Labrenzia sp. EL_126]|nr:hypothetical protein [Labrenzia sp. EL_126]